MHRWSWTALAVVGVALAGSVTAQERNRPRAAAITDPAEAGPDYALQGEYAGWVFVPGSGYVYTGLQIVALGDGKFEAASYRGGLPGNGWDRWAKGELTGELEDGWLVLSGRRGTVVVGNNLAIARDPAGNEFGRLVKVERTSPTLGFAPPPGATVKFDGTSPEQLEGAKITEDGLLLAGVLTKFPVGAFRLHAEFRTPFMPQARGQARGNSGVYLQGRYEVQMLDSFGLEGEQNECGGIYSVAKPDVNMCYPPLSWQTYDIGFTAARYDDQGKLISQPRVTVRHNGVVIHDDVELPGERNTTAAPVQPGPQGGPVYLQDHGNPVRYRNVWVVEKQ